MPDLYNKPTYDALMGKTNIKAYVKKQISVTASELHDQRAKWEDAGMKLPSALAAFHIGKPSICTFWNHAKGAGCKREQDGKKCDRDHKCMWCGSSTHGAYYRISSVTPTSAVYQCPFYEGIRLELLSLNQNASIADLDEFVEELRLKGIPQNSPTPNQASKPGSNTTAAPSSLPHPPKAPTAKQPTSTIPVGGILASSSKKAAKQAKLDKSKLPAAGSPDVTAQASNFIHSTLTIHQTIEQAQTTTPKGTAISPTVGGLSAAQQPKLPTAPNVRTPVAHMTPLATTTGAQTAVADSEFHLAHLLDPIHHPSPIIHPYQNNQQQLRQSSSRTLYGPPPIDMGEDVGAYSLVPENSSPPMQTPPAPSSTVMHLQLHTEPFLPPMEVKIHTALWRTSQSLIYGATFAHAWMNNPMEVVVKLAPLSSDAGERTRQQKQVESEFNFYKTALDKTYHPHLLFPLAREVAIDSGTDQYLMLVMERCSSSLAVFLSTLSKPIIPCSNPLYATLARNLSVQVIDTYLFLHSHERYHRRLICPSNVFVSAPVSATSDSFSLTTPMSTSSPFTAESFMTQELMLASANAPSLRIYDFSLSSSFNPGSDTKDRCYLSPEVSSMLASNTLQAVQNVNPELMKQADLFSIGCLLYFVTSGGYHLFSNGEERDDMSHRTTYLRRHHLDRESPLMLDLINRLTLPVANQRLGLDIAKHHPGLWEPHLVVEFISQTSAELEKSGNPRASLIFDIVASIDFFKHAFPKGNGTWEKYVPQTWLNSWMEWSLAEGKPWEQSYFISIRILLKLLASMTDLFGGGPLGRSHFGLMIMNHLHYLLIALWSHLQSIGEFDSAKHFTFLA